MTTTQPMYALLAPSPHSVIHRIADDAQTDALCGYYVIHGTRWYAIASAPRELPGQHRLCRRCARRAQLMELAA